MRAQHKTADAGHEVGKVAAKTGVGVGTLPVVQVRPLPLLLDVDAVSEQLGVHRATTYQLIMSGAIPSVIVGQRSRRVALADLQSYIERLRTEQIGSAARGGDEPPAA